MPHSDTVYFIINKQTGNAADLALPDLTTAVGNPRNVAGHQKVRSMVTLSTPCLISITM